MRPAGSSVNAGARAGTLFRLASAALVSCALLAIDVQAQILVCMDGDGRKEYGTTCPPGTVSQKAFRPKGIDRQGSEGGAPQSSWQDQERAFQERRIQRETAQAAEAQKQKQQQIAERKCANARRKMEQLQSGRRLRWADKAGERPVMTEEEHAAEMKSVEAELRQCRA